jgi:RimJ/RimL family protein N-acetyltransferase
MILDTYFTDNGLSITMAEPTFHNPIREPLINYKTQEVFHLISLDSYFEVTQVVMDQIIAICNEALVYAFVFEKYLNGVPYSVANANYFIQWAKEGWLKNIRFVFLIITSNNQVAGTIDIRTNNLDGGEIGAWLSGKHSGVMTNAVLKLMELANAAGYKKMFAWVAPTNARSIGALQRLGFIDVSPADEALRSLIRYEITLA